jgi:hypothetical protein
VCRDKSGKQRNPHIDSELDIRRHVYSEKQGIYSEKQGTRDQVAALARPGSAFGHK